MAWLKGHRRESKVNAFGKSRYQKESYAFSVTNRYTSQKIDEDTGLTAISHQADAPEGSQTQTLYTNCNLQISADNTTVVRLSSATDSLVTKYKLSYDGDGSTATGGTGVNTWTDYSTFLTTASAVTHKSTDGAVNVTLYVQASNPNGEVVDAGSYTATQTLTASWTSD